MHFDSLSNFFTQLKGRKAVLLFPPSQSCLVYPHACDHVMDSYAQARARGAPKAPALQHAAPRHSVHLRLTSTPILHTCACPPCIATFACPPIASCTQVDVEAADLARFPALRRARGLEAILEPGDVLWLPSFYWHHVRQLDDGAENLSINIWCGVKDDGSSTLGGRAVAYAELEARAMAAAQADRAAPPDEDGRSATLSKLVACASASEAAAAAAKAAGASWAVALEMEDERVLGGGGGEFAPAEGAARAEASAARAGGGESMDGTLEEHPAHASASRVAASSAFSSAGRVTASSAWAEEESAAAGLRSVLIGRWLEGEAARRVEEAGLGMSAGQLLNAMAAGEDYEDDEDDEDDEDEDEGEGKGEAKPAPSGLTADAAALKVAMKLRLALVDQLGVRATCALLRVLTRHGRLHPGLSPQVPAQREAPAPRGLQAERQHQQSPQPQWPCVVNSEACEQTPADELARMLESHGTALSPYL